jgi:hypothetical protein
LEELRGSLWPWLKRREYADEADDPLLERFISILGRRRAHLRPGLRLHRRWDADLVRSISERELAERIREDVNAVLEVAGEPPIRLD